MESEGFRFTLLAECAPPVRVPVNHTMRGATFSSAASYLMWSVGDTAFLLDLGDGMEPIGAEEKFTFRELIVCHDLQARTVRPGSRGQGGGGILEMHSLLALASGEVLLWKPLQQRRDSSRLASSSSPSSTPCCKEGAADGAAVTLVRWCPGGDASFVTAHSNGQLLLYDRRRMEEATAACSPNASGSASAVGGRRSRMSSSFRGGGSTRPASPSARQSPVSSWQVSASGAAITSLAFSADGRSLAIGLADGIISLFDLAAECPVMRLHSYFGGVLCCCWSNDGRFLISGGEDDLIAVWSVEQRALVARGLAHQSWVQGVAMLVPPRADDLADAAQHPSASQHDTSPDASPDPRAAGTHGRADAVYRVLSCGSDARAHLWEISSWEVELEPDEPDQDLEQIGRGLSEIGRDAQDGTRREAGKDAPPGRGGGGGGSASGSLAAVPAVSFNAVPILSPKYGEQLHMQPMTAVHTTYAGDEVVIATACTAGIVKIWGAPLH